MLIDSFLQNAGAVIGKGGKNIKTLRTDVSTLPFSFHILTLSMHINYGRWSSHVCRTGLYFIICIKATLKSSQSKEKKIDFVEPRQFVLQKQCFVS